MLSRRRARWPASSVARLRSGPSQRPAVLCDGRPRGMKAVKPPVSCWSWRTASRKATRCSVRLARAEDHRRNGPHSQCRAPRDAPQATCRALHGGRAMRFPRLAAPRLAASSLTIESSPAPPRRAIVWRRPSPLSAASATISDGERASIQSEGKRWPNAAQDSLEPLDPAVLPLGAERANSADQAHASAAQIDWSRRSCQTGGARIRRGG